MSNSNSFVQKKSRLLKLDELIDNVANVDNVKDLYLEESLSLLYSYYWEWMFNSYSEKC